LGLPPIDSAAAVLQQAAALGSTLGKVGCHTSRTSLQDGWTACICDLGVCSGTNCHFRDGLDFWTQGACSDCFCDATVGATTNASAAPVRVAVLVAVGAVLLLAVVALVMARKQQVDTSRRMPTSDTMNRARREFARRSAPSIDGLTAAAIVQNAIWSVPGSSTAGAATTAWSVPLEGAVGGLRTSSVTVTQPAVRPQQHSPQQEVVQSVSNIGYVQVNCSDTVYAIPTSATFGRGASMDLGVKQVHLSEQTSV
jgi:hypothetical protein